MTAWGDRRPGPNPDPWDGLGTSGCPSRLRSADPDCSGPDSPPCRLASSTASPRRTPRLCVGLPRGPRLASARRTFGPSCPPRILVSAPRPFTAPACPLPSTTRAPSLRPPSTIPDSPPSLAASPPPPPSPAQVANETVDIGKNTLIELHRQGEQLDQIDISMKAMEEDVEEADSIVKYMRNCFCVTFFACCGNMDPNHKRDATRAKRMAARAAKIDEERAAVAEKHLAAAAAVDRRIQPSQQQVNIPENIPRPGPNATREEWDEYEQEMARAELMSGGGQRQAREPGTSNAWHGLSDQDASELQHETDIQDAHLDIISHALDNMKMIGQDINTELGNQDETLDRLPVRAEKLAMRLDHINKEAQKL